jgi:hypothetical protein
MKNIFFFSFLFAVSSFILFSNHPTKQDKQIDCPIPVFPDSNTVFTGDSCTFRWTHVEQASFYILSVSLTNSFDEEYTFTSKDTTLIIALNDNVSSQYYWRIRSCKNDSFTSKWSDVMTFGAYHAVQERVWRGCGDGCANCPNPCGRRYPMEIPIIE